MIVDDSFLRLTTRMIVRDSISVSCLPQNRRAHSQEFKGCVFRCPPERLVVENAENDKETNRPSNNDGENVACVRVTQLNYRGLS